MTDFSRTFPVYDEFLIGDETMLAGGPLALCHQR